MLMLEKMALHKITEANYITSVNGMIHPDRIMKEHDFLYMLDGSWQIFENNTLYEIKSDDLLILTAGRHHFGKSLCNPGNRHMYIHALPAGQERDAEATGTCTAPGAKSDSQPALFACPSLIHCRKAPRIRQYFHEIISTGWSASAEKENRLSLLFSLLLCEISVFLNQPGDMPPADPMTEEIVRLIQTTPQTFFSPKELSKQYFICERTLNNHFMKAYGKTFSAFQMETRLEMVRQFLLSQPQAKLHEAALNFGFYDEYHLSRAFKKQFGQSPSLYRAQYGRRL